MKQLILIKKIKLTQDVYELIFKSENKLGLLPWQFITFNLPSWLKRAYSISYSDWISFEFIIKRLEDWKWWSKEICDLEIWAVLDYIWPIWHFVLKETENNKLFIGTGTGFAPLYFQIKKALELQIKNKIMFLFWVRFLKDLFYQKELIFLKNTYSNFDFKFYLSKEESDFSQKWYVSDSLNKSFISDFDEFYICWSPNMVNDVRIKLENFWINKEMIFFEQY